MKRGIQRGLFAKGAMSVVDLPRNALRSHPAPPGGPLPKGPRSAFASIEHRLVQGRRAVDVRPLREIVVQLLPAYRLDIRIRHAREEGLDAMSKACGSGHAARRRRPSCAAAVARVVVARAAFGGGADAGAGVCRHAEHMGRSSRTGGSAVNSPTTV